MNNNSVNYVSSNLLKQHVRVLDVIYTVSIGTHKHQSLRGLGSCDPRFWEGVLWGGVFGSP